MLTHKVLVSVVLKGFGRSPDDGHSVGCQSLVTVFLCVGVAEVLNFAKYHCYIG